MMDDITNQRFGIITALSPTNERYHRSVIWKCRCDCGKILYVPKYKLIKKFSCGCINKRRSNLIGTKYGKLTVSGVTGVIYDNTYVLDLVCECGEHIKAIPKQLKLYGKNGNLMCNKCLAEKLNDDLTGQKIGMLTVIKPADYRLSGSIVWHCKCDCGNECDIPTFAFRKHNVNNCGCKGTDFWSEDKYEFQRIMLKIQNRKLVQTMI